MASPSRCAKRAFGIAFDTVMPREYPSLRQALLLLLLLLAVQIGVGLSIVLVKLGLNAMVGQSVEGSKALIVGFANIVAFAIATRFALRRAGIELRNLAIVKPAKGVVFVATVTAVLGSHILISEIGNVVHCIAPPPEFIADLFRGLSDVDHPVGSVFFLVVIAPFTEETFFRGILLPGFLSRFGPALAIGASAFLFGAFHLNPYQMVPGVWLGVLFGWTAWRTGSLFPGIVGHAIHNGLAFFAPMLPFHVQGYNAPHSAMPQFQPLWFDAVGAALMALGVWLLMKYVATR
jgi:membrane protease YdiL (CAAX protease family)